MIIREHYISKISEFFDSDLIKIITGIRRCGKTILLKQIINEISQKSNNIIYLNFEDKATSNNISDFNKLIDYVKDKRKKGSVIYFLVKYRKLINGMMLAKL